MCTAQKLLTAANLHLVTCNAEAEHKLSFIVLVAGNNSNFLKL